MPHRFSEAAARNQKIDPQLEQADWYLDSLTKIVNSKTSMNGLQQSYSAAGEELRPLFGRMPLPGVLDKVFKGKL